ncbi:MAG: hypothetical protein AMK71_00505 [Nitrospira bacterium SG8_35_4]|nr:MAG: hypothetical protein AMK71_00505 [Nitrospira bacterium SG8_35_4]
MYILKKNVRHLNTTMKIFLISEIPLALFMGTFYSFRYDLRTGIIAGLTGGVSVGIILAVIAGVLHRRCVQKISGHGPAEQTGVATSRDIELKMPRDRAFDLCVASLGSINRCTITEENRSQGRIEAKTGINWKTWGDTVSFRLSRLDDDTTNVMLTSRPTARTTLVDFGKNLENVQLIIAFLKGKGEV